MKLKDEIIAFIRGLRLIPGFYRPTIQYFKGYQLIKLSGGITVDRGAFALLARELASGRIKSFQISKDKIVVNDREVDIGKPRNLNHSTLLLSVIYGWDIHEGYVEKNGVKLKSLNYSAIEIFEYHVYDVIDLKGKGVVDIGANIGDSSIFFALKGAKEVIGIEPLPDVYKEAVENVKLNKLDNVKLINAAIGSKKGKVVVPCNLGSNNSGSYKITQEREGCMVDMITLSEIDVNDPYLLKMDCEGCEKDIIMNSYEDLIKFHYILFELHFKGKEKEKILGKFNEKFECKRVSDKLYLCENRR